MEYNYKIIYSYERGYGNINMIFEKRIIDYQDIKELEWKIRKKINVNAHIINYKLINKEKKKESRFDKMEALEYLKYLKNVVDKWTKEVSLK